MIPINKQSSKKILIIIISNYSYKFLKYIFDLYTIGVYSIKILKEKLWIKVVIQITQIMKNIFQE